MLPAAAPAQAAVGRRRWCPPRARCSTCRRRGGRPACPTSRRSAPASSRQAPTAAAALADNATRMARVLAALKRAGVAERDIADRVDRAAAAISLRREPAAGDHRLSGDRTTSRSASATSPRRARSSMRWSRRAPTRSTARTCRSTSPTRRSTRRGPTRSHARAPAPNSMPRRRGCASSASCRSARAARMRGEPQPPMPYHARARGRRRVDRRSRRASSDVTVTLSVRFLLK